MKIYIVTTVSMIIANFGYQFIQSHPDWGAATERSWFQLVAIGGLWLASVADQRSSVADDGP